MFKLYLPRIFSVVVLSASVLFMAPAIFAQSISRTYVADTELPAGTIVGTAGDKATPADSSTAEVLPLGVVVAKDSSLVVVSDGKIGVEVAGEGVLETFVSDLNGRIKKGDPVVLSPLSGFGMLGTNTGRVVGVAESDFDDSQAIDRSVTASSGNQQTVRVGRIKVLLGAPVSFNKSSVYVPTWLSGAARGLAGHEVSQWRIISATIIFVIAIIWAAVLLYSGVVGGILATGRNPLSSKLVLKIIVRLLVYVVIVMILAILLAYAILSL